MAAAQEECPRDLYCDPSAMITKCAIRCGGLAKSSITTRECIVGGPLLPWACACAPPATSCLIPINDACINPATSYSECNAQARSPTFNFVFATLYSNCTVLDCLPLSTNTIAQRVPTPQSPTTKPPTLKLSTTQSPTTLEPTPKPTMEPSSGSLSIASVFFFVYFSIIMFCFRITTLDTALQSL